MDTKTIRKIKKTLATKKRLQKKSGNVLFPLRTRLVEALRKHDIGLSLEGKVVRRMQVTFLKKGTIKEASRKKPWLKLKSKPV
jgi:hypothetical protein